MVGLPTGSLELAAFGASKLGLDKELEACLNKEPGALNRRDEKGESRTLTKECARCKTVAASLYGLRVSDGTLGIRHMHILGALQCTAQVYLTVQPSERLYLFIGSPIETTKYLGVPYAKGGQ